MQAFKKSLIISAALLATTAMWANTYAYLRLSNEAEVNKKNQQLEAME